MLFQKLKDELLNKRKQLLANSERKILTYNNNYRFDLKNTDTNPLAILSHKYAKFYAKRNQINPIGSINSQHIFSKINLKILNATGK